MKTLLAIVLFLFAVRAEARIEICEAHKEVLAKNVCQKLYMQAIQRAHALFTKPTPDMITVIDTTVHTGFSAGVIDAVPTTEFKHLASKYCHVAKTVIQKDCAQSDAEKTYLANKLADLCDGVLPEDQIRPNTGDVSPSRGAKKILDMFGGKSENEAIFSTMVALPAYTAGVVFEHTYQHSVAAAWLEKLLGPYSNDLYRCGIGGVVLKVYSAFVEPDIVCNPQDGILMKGQPPRVEILKMFKSDLADVCKQ